jgi:hypothetical protein
MTKRNLKCSETLFFEKCQKLLENQNYLLIINMGAQIQI